jgi:hypothetical protein
MMDDVAVTEERGTSPTCACFDADDDTDEDNEGYEDANDEEEEEEQEDGGRMRNSFMAHSGGERKKGAHRVRVDEERGAMEDIDEARAEVDAEEEEEEERSGCVRCVRVRARCLQYKAIRSTRPIRERI